SLAKPSPACIGTNEEIFQIHPGFARPRRVVQEEERQPLGLAIDLPDDALGDRGAAVEVAEEGVADVLGLGDRLLGGFLVFGKLLDELQDERDVIGRGWAQCDRGHAACYACGNPRRRSPTTAYLWPSPPRPARVTPRRSLRPLAWQLRRASAAVPPSPPRPER